MYKYILKDILNPFYELVIKRRNMLKYREFLDKSQWWPYEKLQAFQWVELTKLLKHAYDNVPYWRGQFDRLGLISSDIKTYEDFCRIPVTNKMNIRENYEEMRAINYNGKTWKKATGGSTGEPLHFEYTPESYDWRVAASKRGYSWAGCEDGEKQAYIWGVRIGNESFLKQLKESIHRKILRQLYFNCFKFGDNEMTTALKTLNKYQPRFMVGYANQIYNFAKFIERHNDLKFKPKSVITGAEKIYDFQKDTIARTFNCEVFNTYGCREFMLIACECTAHKGFHVNMENLFVEILKSDGSPTREGEVGDLVITDLHNYGMPFIRYKIGDMAMSSSKECECGRKLALIGDIMGRSLDAIRTPDGRLVSGVYFPHLMKEFDEVRQFQVIQDRIDHITVKIVEKCKFTESRFSFMKEEIVRTLGDGISIDFTFVDEIPLTATGKHRVTISELEDIHG